MDGIHYPETRAQLGKTAKQFLSHSEWDTIFSTLTVGWRNHGDKVPAMVPVPGGGVVSGQEGESIATAVHSWGIEWNRRVSFTGPPRRGEFALESRLSLFQIESGDGFVTKTQTLMPVGESWRDFLPFLQTPR